MIQGLHGPIGDAIANGTFNLMARTFIAAHNRGLAWQNRIGLMCLDNNLGENIDSSENLDCMFCQVIERGQTEVAANTGRD